MDKGDGTVGIPITGHAFIQDQEVTIAGSTNYNNSYRVVSQTVNEIVITETFVSETFAGTETVVSSVKTIALTGLQTGGTFATTESNLGTHHQITHSGNAIDIVYVIDVGDTKTAVEVITDCYLTSNNDTIDLQVYDLIWIVTGKLS